MKNLFKRNRTYYIRIKVPTLLHIYFNSNLYIKSLKTNNRKNAMIILNSLMSKLNYIKNNMQELTHNHIKALISEFKNQNYNLLLNKYNLLNINEIDEQIEELSDSKNIKADNVIIKSEFEELVTLFETIYDSPMFMVTNDKGEKAIFDSLIKFKINTLYDVKKKLESNIINTNKINNIIVNNSNVTNNSNINNIDNTSNITNTTTAVNPNGVRASNVTNVPVVNPNSVNVVNQNKTLLKESIDRFVIKKQNEITPKAANYFKLYLERLLNYCLSKKILYVQDVKHSMLIEFRDSVLSKTYNSVNALNNYISHISSYFAYCIENEDITKNPALKVSKPVPIKEQKQKERVAFEDEDIQMIIDNIDLLRINQRRKIKHPYYDEYLLIIRIAMFSGMREEEITLLKKEEIKCINGIYVFDINFETRDHLKTINAERYIPIHSEILDELLLYVKNLKRKQLFNITADELGKRFSRFKIRLGISPKKVFHSFRKSFANKLKQALANKSISQELLGHVKSDDDKMTLDCYADPYYVNTLKDTVEIVKYNVKFQ